MDQNQQNLDSAMRCMDLIACRGRQEVKAMAAAFQLIEATQEPLKPIPVYFRNAATRS